MMRLQVINSHLPERFAHVIGEWATQALMVEAHLHPKPGLVTCVSSGSHRDMDIDTFRLSATTLKPFLVEFSHLGLSFPGTDLTKLLAALRPVGMQAEQAMMSATGQINTHKGAIFILGILCAALGYMMASRIKVSSFHLQNTVRKMCKDVTNELDNCKHASAGVHAYQQYGVTGIRGEAESGFPTLMQGFNAFKRAKHAGYSNDHALQLALLTCMSINDDSCLIKRGGISGLNYAKDQAKSLLNLKLNQQQMIDRLNLLDNKFVARNLSPGGSADCLSAIWLIYTIQTFAN